MKKLLIIILSGIATLTLAAETPDVSQPYNGPGAYINLNAGLGTMQNMANSSFAMGANAGYNFNRALAVEGGWTGLPSQQAGRLATYNIYDVAVRGTLPLSDVFSLYGRLGVAMGYSTWSSNCNCNVPTIYQSSGSAYNYGGLVGIGMSFVLSRHFDLRLEDYAFIPVSGQSGNFGTANMVMGGVQFNF